MGKRYWVAAITLVLTLAGAALAQEEHSSPVPVKRPSDERIQSNTAPDVEESSNDTTTHRVIVTSEPGEALRAEERQNRDDQRADEDLNAQMRMADAAMDLVWLTKIQIVIGIAGTFALIGTLLLMHRANNASLKVAEAAVITARSDIESKTAKLKIEKLELSRGLGTGSLGIGLLGVGEEAPLKDVLRQGFVSIVFRNDGPTHAHMRYVEYGAIVGKPPNVPTYPEITRFGHNEYVGTNPVTRTIFLQLTESDIDRVVANEQLWVYGRATFENYLGETRRIPFCGVLFHHSTYFPESLSFILSGPAVYWRQENSDEDKKPNRLLRLIKKWRVA